MRHPNPAAIAAVTVALVAIVAVALWPRYIERSANVAAAAVLPTPAPVVPDYLNRDRLVAFWEKAENERHPGDMISPDHLAEQYLQRYRERMDIDDVLRAEQAAKQSLVALPAGNLPGELELASVYLTLHRFHDALAVTKHIESYDGGDVSMYPREASLDMEVGDYARAARLLASVPAHDRDDGWRVVDSRYLELTGHLAAARTLLATASAYQNAAFDAPAQQRAWYFFRQGEMAFEAGDNDAALGDEREAVAIFPGYADALRTLARIECAVHDWQQCLTDAVASAGIVPYPETLGYEADAQRGLGDAAGAAQTADLIHTIGALGDQQHITDRLLAIYYADHHLYPDVAYGIAKRELLARDDIFTDDTLAWAAAMDGRWDEARTRSARALRYGTQNALLEYHAGVIAAHFNARAAAKKHFQRALALNPSFDPVFAGDARIRITVYTSSKPQPGERQGL
jgi:tetratricopeptide (TPR) repeat protein